MLDRRELLTLGGLMGALAPGREAAAEGVGNGVAQLSDKNAQDVVNAIKAITTTIAADRSFDAIGPLRLRQADYLKAQGKFPDFIDVSVDVWMGVYDWHVRLQQPLVTARDPPGRYTLMLGFTMLVLRPDVAPNFISTPYDSR